MTDMEQGKGATRQTPKRSEPEVLRRGKRFDRDVKARWRESAEGDVRPQEPTTKPGGRKGWMDVYVRSDGSLVAVVEAKASNWDAMTPTAARRNIRRQCRQIWDYIESRLQRGEEVSPGIVFPKRPRDHQRVRLIEKEFEEEGIAVVWEDESLSERRTRL